MHPTPAILKSFIEPHALAQLLETHYEMANPRCKLMKATIRDVYRVDSDAGKHVAIIYPPQRSAEMVTEEIAITDLLLAHGLPVVTPITRHDGTRQLTLFMPEGARQLVVLPFIEAAFTRSPSAETVHRYGQVVAQMHLATDSLFVSSLRPVFDTHRLIFDILPHLCYALDDRPALVAELERFAAAVAPRLEALAQTAPAFGFVHGDIAPSNALVAADGTLTLIDFDLCGLGWRMMDVASYLNEIDYWRMGALEDVFLEGYTGTRPLSKSDIALLPVFRIATALHELHHAAAHVNTWSTNFYLSDTILHPGLQMMRQQLALL